MNYVILVDRLPAVETDGLLVDGLQIYYFAGLLLDWFSMSTTPHVRTPLFFTKIVYSSTPPPLCAGLVGWVVGWLVVLLAGGWAGWWLAGWAWLVAGCLVA